MNYLKTNGEYVTKKELIEYLLSRNDIPDDAEVKVAFDFQTVSAKENRNFWLILEWDEFAKMKEPIIEFGDEDSKQIANDILSRSVNSI